MYNIKNKITRKTSRVFFSPNKKKKLTELRKIKNTVVKNLSRATSKIKKLQFKLNAIQNEMKAISNVSLQQIIKNNNIPTCQTDLIYEIFNASKVKNPKNRRYSENWMLLCLLFQIRYIIFFVNKILYIFGHGLFWK